MIFRSLILGAATLALMACEPVETSETATETETAGAGGGLAMPSGLTREQQSIWNTYSDAGKKHVNECMATGKTYQACTAV